MNKKYFDKIYCINLDSRIDRWAYCSEEFKKLGIENEVERFPGIALSPGIAGCTRSHYEVIRLAKQNKFNNVLILEDDFTVTCDNFSQVLDKAVEQLKVHDVEYDILYLGGNLSTDTSKNYLVDSNLAKLTYCKTTHSYIINSSAYDIFLDIFNHVDWDNPNNWTHTNNNRLNIDVSIIKHVQSRGKTFGVYPCLTEQRAGYSNLTYSINYFNLSKSYNEILGNTKHE